MVVIGAFFARTAGRTACDHRHFPHRTLKISRVVQFLGTLLGNAAGPRWAIWWASHHRHHHRASDQPNGIHGSAQQRIGSHVLWSVTAAACKTDHREFKDWLHFPERRMLGRFDFPGATLLSAVVFLLGEMASVDQGV